MERRKVLATAGAFALTAATATLAVGATLGLFGIVTSDAKVGNLSPIEAARPAPSESRTIYVDDPIPVPDTAAPAPQGSGAWSPAPQAAPTPAPQSSGTRASSTPAPQPRSEPQPQAAPAPKPSGCSGSDDGMTEDQKKAREAACQGGGDD